MSLARNYIEGVHPPAIGNTAGIQQGNVVVYDVPSTTDGSEQVNLPTGTAPWLTAPFGIADSAGFVGGSGSNLGEALSIARQGLWRALLSANLTTTRGQELIADAGTLGNVAPRTPYTSSAWVLGTAEEAYGPSATADLIEMYAQPYLKEVIRDVVGSAATAIGAATKYLSAVGTAAGSSTAVVLAVVPFNGCVARNLVVSAQTAPAGTDTGIFTVYRNPLVTGAYTGFVATALTCTITGTGVFASDLAHAVACNQGDLLAIQCVSSATTLAGINAQFDIT